MSDEKLFGESLPGTGGDFIDEGDVEGHGNKHIQPMPPTATDQDQDEDTEGHRRHYQLPGATEDAGPGPESGHRQLYAPVTGDEEDDTEGHRRNFFGQTAAPDDAGPDGVRHPQIPNVAGEDDTEGHRRNFFGQTAAPGDAGPDGVRHPQIPNVAGEDDVEGHRRNYFGQNAVPDDVGPAGMGKKTGGILPPTLSSDEDDVEGHMAPDGFVKRAPDEMPHGER